MKTFIVFPTKTGPYQVQAETYTRDGELIHFHGGGQIIRTLRADSLLTIIEQKDDGEPKDIQNRPDLG